MILPDTPPNDTRTTLDDLFRRAAVRHPDALALVDPPNRAAVTGGIAHSLTYAEADRIVWAIAKRLRRLGLQTDAVIALQLPNTVESILTLLGVLRAGMIAALLPTLWRKADMIAALAGTGTRMLITSARIGLERPCEAAMQTAAGLFSIRYVGAYGQAPQDGIVALDDIFTLDNPGVLPAIVRSGDPAAHTAVVTWEATTSGTLAVARNHQQLIGGGLAVFLEGRIENDATILSAIPAASFAGIATTVVPWLLSGGTLALHHPFEADTFAAQYYGLGTGTVVIPGPLAAHLLSTTPDESKTIIALWRAPERNAVAPPPSQNSRLIDVTAFGETGLVALCRPADGTKITFPCGTIAVPYGTPAAVPVIETRRNESGDLALRGGMVSAAAFPPGAKRDGAAGDGFVNLSCPCRLDADNTLIVTGPSPGMVGVGGYRFSQQQLDALVAELSRDATIVALPDPLTGQRLAGISNDDAVMRIKLADTGCNPLIVRAFGMRNTPDAASV